MGDFVIFSEQVAAGLLARGFKLRGLGSGKSRVWYFDDSVLLRKAVEELTTALSEDNE